MKLSAKPLSSPGRSEKFPPPLMRFLRSNVGSRSRGRSRASPMFVRKKSTAIETQEPTSPKVTCIGQVRVRRSKQAAARPVRARRAGASARRRCRWIRKPLFCHHCTCGIKPKSFRPAWRKWTSCFQGSSRSKVEIRGDSSRTKSNGESETQDLEPENKNEDDEAEEKETTLFVSNSCSPPKNALLLMRSRSAPYRSSSLASQFWSSSSAAEESAEQANAEEQDDDHKPASETESICKDSDQESRMDPETEKRPTVLREFRKSANAAEESTSREGGGSARPLILTRCKSEPARTAEKLDPEVGFWKKRRLGLADSC